MKFLLPVGGVSDSCFGYLTAPNHLGIIAGIQAGCEWGADLGCVDGPEYVKRIDIGKTLPWLETMEAYRATCLFIAGFDVVGNARRTVETFAEYAPKFAPWSLAFVAQDGQENIDFPPADQWQTLFIGGSTRWKLSEAAESCIYRAARMGKRVHIGRVNWWKRYKHFESMEGSYAWTCDGTRTRYGADKALEDWRRYMAAPHQPRLFVPGGSHSR